MSTILVRSLSLILVEERWEPDEQGGGGQMGGWTLGGASFGGGWSVGQ